jgi:arabinogalactan endo-1,4-beta-galactosidase
MSLAVWLAGTVLAATAGAGLARGVDVSSLVWRESALAAAAPGRDLFVALQRRGVDLVRLRVWHTPADGACAPAAALALARRADAAGLAVLLDLHYSDRWADPGRQDPPAAWRGLAHRTLADSVRRWTREVLADFVRAGVEPAAVQLGNEVTAGLLWPHGRLTARPDPESRLALARLLRAAVRGAREGSPRTRTLLHIDRGGDPAAAERWFAERLADGVRVDGFALSYHPWWHGPLDSLRATLARLERFRIPVRIVETAHPWTLAWSDATHNVVGAPWHDPDRFGATPAGQRDFLAALDAVVRASRVGAGWCYWEPLDVSTPARGSAWENLALVDTAGAWMPAWEVFGRP